LANEHTWPQAPQFAGSLLVSTPHAVPLQLAKVPWQMVVEQAPLWQVSFGAQATPHAPQLFTSLDEFTSQPSAALWLQSAKLAAHVSPQVPLQVAVEFGPEAHAFPHAPQLLTSEAVLISHPSAACPSQSAKPALHSAMAHAPAAQTGAALDRLHAFRHAPQLLASRFVSTSHPFAGFASQSAKPALHAKVQAPALHADAAFVAVHAFPHAPQLLTSAAVLISHPSAACPSQSAKPALHVAMPHAPAVQEGVALGVTHAFPHAPQLFASEAGVKLQPVRLWSQSAYPGWQTAVVHAPFTQPSWFWHT
jgi:hypothetical protein